MTKPLFIPLKREWFEAFRTGLKTVEYRPHGPRWNERTCWVGRPVVLSLGYGKAHRLTGRITEFWASEARTPAFVSIYGHDRIMACIRIDLDSLPSTESTRLD